MHGIETADAFLSYTHLDDRRDRGRITQFRQELAEEVHAVTGEPFEIFQDVDGIGIGEHWPGKLDQMLDEARFFIPILTPSYFKSKACRNELQKFMMAEKTAQRDDLILPIYWCTCRVLEREEVCAFDPLATIIHQRQRRDWRQLRDYAFRTRKVRLAMQEIATAIEEARERIQPTELTDFQPPQHWRLEALQGQPSLTPAATQWSHVRGALREEFDETAFRTWLAPITLMGVEGDRVLLGVPTRFLRDWVAAHYADRIRTLWRRINPTTAV